jgi:hypothetical protein
MATGTSPRRFLSAVRLHKAKNLLLETSTTVTNISYDVGYNSLGSFISRFTKSVGISPARYRTLSQSGIPVVSTPSPRDPRRRESVHGSLRLPRTDVPIRVYVGAFESMIAQGRPIACDILDTPRAYRLAGVPDGEWFIRAIAVATSNIDPRPWHRQPLFVSRQTPVTVSGAPAVVHVDMRPVCPVDLPVLLALPELDNLSPPTRLAPESSTP